MAHTAPEGKENPFGCHRRLGQACEPLFTSFHQNGEIAAELTHPSYGKLHASRSVQRSPIIS